MKLVELLAAKLEKWADTTVCYVQDPGGDVWPCKEIAYRYCGSWSGDHGLIDQSDKAKHFEKLDTCDDHENAIVTRSQWQAERDRQKGGEWKRHRGGKCPVPAGTKVSTRHRDGEVVDVHFQTAEYGTHKAVMDCVWKHDGSKHDIMAYKVISQPQAEEVEVKDTTIGTLSYKVEIDTTEASQAIDELAAKWDQVDGPLRWRDCVNELDAYIEEFTREREALINRLAVEGFALIPAMTAVMGVADVPAVDMHDWLNWEVGDVVEVIANMGGHEFAIGDRVHVVGIDLNDSKYRIEAQLGDGDDWWLLESDAKWISRP